jgi:phage tail sheath protein FI
MATTYKTPGVYVEEIPKLPPSVAQVETALPAFIGYTARAAELSPNDLLNKPKRLSSLVEYEQYYGGGPSPVVTEVNIDSSNNFVSAKVDSKFYLYDALRMFYANGGGDCYIVSVGISESSTTVSDVDLINGITALEKEDAPTIILFPDAVSLTADKMADVQKKALDQCNNLQDRVGLFDVKYDDPLGATFRDKIGINFLKYGAVYTPWLKVSLPKAIKYPDVASVIKRSGIGVVLSALTTNDEIRQLAEDTARAYADKYNVTQKTISLNPPDGIISDGFNALVAAFNSPGGNDDANLKSIFEFIYNIGAQVDEFITGGVGDALTLQKFINGVTTAIGNEFDPLIAQVVSVELEVADDITDTAYVAEDITTYVTAGTWTDSAGAAASTDITEDNDDDRRIAAVNILQELFLEVDFAYQKSIINAAASWAKTLDDSLAINFPVYKSILTGVSNSMTVMPPSGAVAGVYAQVDRTRGVWKAPANVSLSNVLGPDTVFTASQLENLNVDAVAGKSVNAIRFFTGKGTLVFGARTLAGNDNEWRYISVRRFFNMVEESCKKATEPFVFEPNDANTWVKIQGMIENFLTTLWRQGALQGAKPEHAFYVAVGLGKTMTALDILEGRLIVEIGMAVVRPAEFIILRFSHKMAES